MFRNRKWIFFSYSLLGKSIPLKPPKCGTFSLPLLLGLLWGTVARNSVFSAFRDVSLKSTQELHGWIRVSPTSHLLYTLSPNPKAAEFVLTVSMPLEKISYLFHLSFYFWAQNQFREPDGKWYHAISSIAFISSHSPSLTLSTSSKFLLKFASSIIVAEFLIILGISPVNLLLL